MTKCRLRDGCSQYSERQRVCVGRPIEQKLCPYWIVLVEAEQTGDERLKLLAEQGYHIEAEGQSEEKS